MVTAQSIQISVDKNRLQEGELLKLSIQVVDGEDFAEVDLGPLESDFDIISGESFQLLEYRTSKADTEFNRRLKIVKKFIKHFGANNNMTLSINRISVDKRVVALDRDR